jgi:hypothetical protein
MLPTNVSRIVNGSNPARTRIAGKLASTRELSDKAVIAREKKEFLNLDNNTQLIFPSILLHICKRSLYPFVFVTELCVTPPPTLELLH